MNLTYLLIGILFIDLILSLLNSKTLNLIGLIKLSLIVLSYMGINNKTLDLSQLLLLSSLFAFITSNNSLYKVILNFFFIYFISNNGVYNLSSYEYSVLVFISIVTIALKELYDVSYFMLIFPTICKIEMVSAFVFYSLFSSLVLLRRRYIKNQKIRKVILSLVAIGLFAFMDFTQDSKLLISINIILFTNLLLENMKLIKAKEA